jgi:imidazolonepropionase-like amidohydrolase
VRRLALVLLPYFVDELACALCCGSLLPLAGSRVSDFDFGRSKLESFQSHYQFLGYNRPVTKLQSSIVNRKSSIQVAVTLSLSLLFFTALTLSGSAQEEWLAVEGGTLFDGTGAVRQDHSILVRGQEIQEVAPLGHPPPPRNARRFDARGKFILPGLIDLHFHFNVRIDPKISPWLPLHFLANGVTTLREMGNWIVEENQRWSAEIQARGLPVPRLLYTGPVLDGANPLIPDQSLVLLDEMDARREANRLLDQGASSLKVYSRLPLNLVRVVIEEAHRRGRPVHSHLGIVDPRDAIAAGLDGIEHATSLCRIFLSPRESEAFRQASLKEGNPGSMRIWTRADPAGPEAAALIELMLRHKINLDSTLALHEARREARDEDRVKAVRNMADFTVRYQRAGGSVTIGSHGKVPNAPPGLGFHRELEMHVEAGMSPSDALQAATRVGARALRLEDRGVIAKGKLADLVILDGDPLQDISNLRRVHAVILGGKILDRDALFASREILTGTGEKPEK